MERKIHIKPCSAHWNTMEISDKNRICHFCTKEVIDFTNFTNEEIITSLSTKSNTCGRVKTTQVNSIDTHFIKPSPSFWKKFFFLFVTLFGFKNFQSTAFAQETIRSNNKSNIEDNKQAKMHYIKAKLSTLPEQNIKANLIIDSHLVDQSMVSSDSIISFTFSVNQSTIKDIQIELNGINSNATIIVPVDSLNKASIFKPQWYDAAFLVKQEKEFLLDGIMMAGIPEINDEEIDLIRENKK